MNGYRWGFTFLKTEGILSLDDRIALLHEATAMYIDGQKIKSIKKDGHEELGYEGILRSKGNFEAWEGWSGVRFDADVDTNYSGKVKLSFLN